MSHTPTPWKVDGTVPGAPEIVVDSDEISPRRIAVVLFHGASKDVYPNAAFIVEACNAYEKLKKERDDLLTVAYRAERKISECSDDLLADDWKDIRDHAREAIALCEGGKE